MVWKRGTALSLPLQPFQSHLGGLGQVAADEVLGGVGGPELVPAHLLEDIAPHNLLVPKYLLLASWEAAEGPGEQVIHP